MRHVELKRSLENADLEAAYDAYAKKLLSHKIVLAWIMHGCLEEYHNIDPQVIADHYIEHTEVSNIGVFPGDATELIRGGSSEDSTPRERTVTYDILFRALAEKGEDVVELILNVEAQNRYHPGYPLESRGIFYCSRMISSQYGREFQGTDYNKIKKVYSIWLCTNPPKEYQNTIATYAIKEQLNIGNKPRKRENYDLLSVVMVGLGNPKQKELTGVIKFLSTLLSNELEPKQKEEILQRDFHVPMNDEMKKEAELMCNLSQGILQTGIQQGMEQGIKQGIEQGIKTMAIEMYAEGDTLEKIARVAKVSVEQVKIWLGIGQCTN